MAFASLARQESIPTQQSVSRVPQGLLPTLVQHHALFAARVPIRPMVVHVFCARQDIIHLLRERYRAPLALLGNLRQLVECPNAWIACPEHTIHCMQPPHVLCQLVSG